MEQICINSPETIASAIGLAVLGASSLANIIPAPDKINNPILRFISRIIHFAAVDIVTAVKK